METQTSLAGEAPALTNDALAGFLERFFRFGAEPGVASYMALFHRDARLFDDGMAEPIGIDEIPAHIELTLALVPGFTMVPERWRTRGDAVFVEARNRGEIGGSAASWRSVYRVHLVDGLVVRGRRFYDRGPLLARIDPATPRLPRLLPESPEPVPACPARGFADAGPGVREVVELVASAWREGRPERIAELHRDDSTAVVPGLPRPLGRDEVAPFCRRFREALGGVRLSPVTWAGDDSLLFVEWQGDVATPGGGSHALGLVERMDLVDGRILAARSYFDTAALARALAPG
jgi:uncharacterized protein (TIGR02246 family)